MVSTSKNNSKIDCVLDSESAHLNICRRGEETKTFFRSDRFYKIDGRYYFSTREGVEVGPYESKPDAEAGLERFIDSMVKSGDAKTAKRLALSGNWAVTMFQ